MPLSRGRDQSVEHDEIAAWLDLMLPSRRSKPTPLVDLLGDDDMKLEGDILAAAATLRDISAE